MSEPIDYSGWAPCVHKPEERSHAQIWLFTLVVTDDFTGTFDDSLLGFFLWGLPQLGASVTLDADQWTRCVATGKVGKREVRTNIQGDCFTLSVGETYRIWKEIAETGSFTEGKHASENRPAD